MTDVTEELDTELTTRKGVWEQVPHMFGQAPVCTACGQAPRDEEDNLLPAYNAVGVDVDWGNHLFLCVRCVDILVELHGALPAEKVKKLKRQINLQAEELDDKDTKLAKQQEQIDKIVAGAKARKELKNG